MADRTIKLLVVCGQESFMGCQLIASLEAGGGGYL